MLKILFQNIFLPDGKAILSFLLFIYLYIYILNILKVLKILSLISLLVNSCSATMVNRRSKDKHPTTDTTKQLVKQEFVSPIDIANHFTTSGTVPNQTTPLC